MAAYNKFNVFTDDMAHGFHVLQSHVLKVMLTNVAPVATNTVKANITEIAAGNGYTAGGNTAAFTSLAQAPAGTSKLILADPTIWTCVTAPMATFRYAVLYNDTQTSPVKPLIGWWDYGSAITLAVGEQFFADLDQAAGVLTIT